MLKVINSILLSIICIIVMMPKAGAVIEVQEYMGDDFLPYQGYSTEMLRLVKINRAKTFAEPQPDHWPKNPIRRAVKKFYAYIDPAEDVGDFGNHDTIMQTTMWDY